MTWNGRAAALRGRLEILEKDEKAPHGPRVRPRRNEAIVPLRMAAMQHRTVRWMPVVFRFGDGSLLRYDQRSTGTRLGAVTSTVRGRAPRDL